MNRSTTNRPYKEKLTLIQIQISNFNLIKLLLQELNQNLICPFMCIGNSGLLWEGDKNLGGMESLTCVEIEIWIL